MDAKDLESEFFRALRETEKGKEVENSIGLNVIWFVNNEDTAPHLMLDGHFTAADLMELARAYNAAVPPKDSPAPLTEEGADLDASAGLNHRGSGALLKQYQTIAMYKCHLTEDDFDSFQAALSDGNPRIMSHYHAYFLKLYDAGENDSVDFSEGTGNYQLAASPQCKAIIQWAYNNGYRMIEFDLHAPVIDLFPLFEY